MCVFLCVSVLTVTGPERSPSPLCWRRTAAGRLASTAHGEVERSKEILKSVVDRWSSAGWEFFVYICAWWGSLPLPLRFPAVRPVSHCEMLALGSASGGTVRFEPLTPDPALSAQGFTNAYILNEVDWDMWAKNCAKQRLGREDHMSNPLLIQFICCVSLLPPPAGGSPPWCHDTSWWPGPLCLSTALRNEEEEGNLMNGGRKWRISDWENSRN